MKKLLAFIAMAATSTAVAGVFDDVSYWFRGCCNGLVDAKPQLDNYEFPNALTIGTGKNPSGDLFEFKGARTNMQVVVLDVPCPYAGTTLAGRETLRFIQPSADNATILTKLTASAPFAFKKADPCTVVLRFKRESPVEPSATWCSLLNFAYSYSADSGMRIALSDNGSDSYNVEIWLGQREKHVYSAALPYGKWIDLAVTLAGKTDSGTTVETTVYVCPEDTDLKELSYGIYYRAEAEGVSYPSTTLSLGGYTSDAATKFFRGWVQQIGLWRRCLSRSEVLEAFCNNVSQGDVWRLGVANDSSDDFSGTNYVKKTRPISTDVAAQTDYRFMPKALNAERMSATVDFTLDGTSAMISRTFALKSTTSSDAASFSVSVNGLAAGTASVAPGETASVVIPAHVFVSGANALTVTRTDSGEGDLALDQLALTNGPIVASNAEPVADDVFADAYRWFRSPVDIYGNGYLCDASMSASGTRPSLYGFPDFFHQANPQDEANAVQLRGVWSNVVITTGDVALPARGITLHGEKSLYFSQFAGETAGGTPWVMGGGLRYSLFPATNAASYTVVTRFKFDSYVSATSHSAQLFGFGYLYSDKAGLAFTISGDPDNFYFKPNFGAHSIVFDGTQTGGENVRLSAGQWIDLAVVVSNGYARICTQGEGGDFLSQPSVNLPSNARGTSRYSPDLHLGTQSGASEDSPSTTGAFAKFRGWIHHVAVWPRALSDGEVRDAFAWPAPDVFRIGAANGAGGEFTGGIRSTVTPLSNGATTNVPPAIVTKDDTLTISFDVPADEAARSQLFRFAVAGDSVPGAAISLALNGEPVVRYDEAYAPEYSFSAEPGTCVEVGVLQRFLRAGRNTLVISRTDAVSGALLIDAVSLGRHGRHVHVRGSGCLMIIY